LSSIDGYLTVLCGSRLAILRANSMAYSEGLQIIGVFGKTSLGLGFAKWPIMSNIWKLLALVVFLVVWLVLLDPTNSMSSSSSETVFLWIGLSVSKHIIPSKQSSNPSLLSALIAWTLSAFVKIYRENKIMIFIRFHSILNKSWFSPKVSLSF
jgi:hypothetical protein